MHEPFIVYALPRSRTFWLSRYLTYGEVVCSHDQLIQQRSFDDITSWYKQGLTGTVETAAAYYWRLTPQPIKTIVIRRNVDDVIQSCLRQADFDVDKLARAMRKLNTKLDQITKRVDGARSYTYDELNQESVCQEIFEYCLPYKHDPIWYQNLASLNLQVNIRHQIRYMDAYAPQLSKFADIAYWKMKSQMSLKFSYDTDDLSFQEEPFDIVYRDGQKLFAEHCVLVGETPDSFDHKNLGLMRQMNADGCLQFMTARCNGRMVGYLAAILTPSLEGTHIKCASHNMFYTSPDFPESIGLKLERASIAQLNSKGITEVLMHAGIRGSGPRLGTMYKRLGARPFGEMYKLELNPPST